MSRINPATIEKYALKILHANKEIGELLSLLSNKENIKYFYKKHPQDIDEAVQLLTKAREDINNAIGKLMGFEKQ